MAATLTAPTFSIATTGQVSFNNGTLVTANTLSGGANLSQTNSIAVGSSASQCSGMYRADINTGTSTFATVNLSTLSDQEGNTLGFVHIGTVLVINPAGSVTLTMTPTTGGTGFTGGQLPAGTVGQVASPGSPLLIFDSTFSLAFAGGTASALTFTTSPGTTAYSFPICVQGRNA